MTEPLFPKLLGIQKHREVVERPQTSLEKLLEIEVEITKRYAAEVQGKGIWDLKPYYEMLAKELQERTAQLPYTARDLEDLVHTKINSSYNDSRQIALGLLTGALLDILTQRNRRKGKETVVKVNGNDGKFSYLFAYARNADSIDVENFEGNNICLYLGSFGGEVKKALAKNIKGNNTLAYAGSYKGSVGSIEARSIKGDLTLVNTGSNKGSVKAITAHDITGDWTLADAGRNKGSVKSITAHDITGDYTLEFAGRNKGSVKSITAHDITGDYTLANAGINKGSVKAITAHDITGNWTLWCAGSNGSVGSIKYKNLRGKEVLSGAVAKSKICEDEK